METLSLIANTGIQFYTLKEKVKIDFNASVCKGIRFFEFQVGDKIFLDPVYYFPNNDKYIRRQDLICGGYMNKESHEIVPEEEINFNVLNCLEVDHTISVNNLDTSLKGCASPLQALENRWLPLPFYEKDINGHSDYPLNWCRMKLLPDQKLSTDYERVYDVLLTFDTQLGAGEQKDAPQFGTQTCKFYSLCGISAGELAGCVLGLQNHIQSVVLPLKAYEFCDLKERSWIDTYIKEILHGEDFDLGSLETGKKLKYLAYYMYFICYLHRLQVLPDVCLYSDMHVPVVDVSLVLDIGNSRTFGLIAEDSLEGAAPLHICDLETGEPYTDPFDMCLTFKDERFGNLNPSGDEQFKWPSIVRLGKEALRNIYSEKELGTGYDTYCSSPKRYLWDGHSYAGQWKFISEPDQMAGSSRNVFMEGLSQQFHNDGSFAADPREMGNKSAYSRRSLMTFAFIELLLQARMQANSMDYRDNRDKTTCKRVISRIIITCPTAMPRSEQLILRKCAQEATIVLKRYFNKTYTFTYDAVKDREKVEIVPSVRDLSLTMDNIDDRRYWGYDEAACCQMVYLYAELKRYLGNCEEFFGLYGKKRRDNALGDYDKSSLTIGSLDIGAGTSDLMICCYKYAQEGGAVITPVPLFWESFQTAGDDIVKGIITKVLLEDSHPKYIGCSGIITEKLKEMQCRDISDKMHTFFGDAAVMGVKDKQMRREFNTQVFIPMANKLLDLLQRGEKNKVLKFDDFFDENRPASQLMDHFAAHFGFRFEDLYVKYSAECLNEIIRKVFEPHLRKWTSILYAYKCDVVLLGGRPASLQQIYDLILRLYPVAPNRLISMNTYRVGNWYPGSTGTGKFGDRKSLVAVGALIAWLGEKSKFPLFKLNMEVMKRRIQPTSEYIGFFNPRTGELNPLILTPLKNRESIRSEALPLYLGCKQLDVRDYPARLLYMLDFDEDYIRREAVRKLGEGADPKCITDEMQVIKARVKQKVPLTFRLEREYRNDKEALRLDSVETGEGDELSVKLFMLTPQSWAEDDSHWLDTGKFILHIGLNK